MNDFHVILGKFAVIKRVWRRRRAYGTAVKILHQNYFWETAVAFCWAPSEFKITMVAVCGPVVACYLAVTYIQKGEII